jgi:hypothetical protein
MANNVRRILGHLGSEVFPIVIFLALSTNISSEVYAFHGNATEDAFLENPETTGANTGLACEEGNSNEAVLNIVKTSKARATFQCISNSTIVFSFEEENAIWGWSIIELLKTRATFSVDEIVSSGVGSVGNPTRFYVVMSGPP